MRKTEEVSFDFSEDKKKAKKGFWGFVYEWIDTVMLAVLIITLVFAFAFRIVGVEGASMNPTLQSGDWLAVRAVNTEINRGDIVVITQPNALGKPLIKRVIAKGGDTVDINYFDHTVMVNGQILDEPYIAEPTNTLGDRVFPLTVPEGQLFVMGDNRNESADSRSKYIGFIDEKYVLGVSEFRLFPVSSFGEVK